MHSLPYNQTLLASKLSGADITLIIFIVLVLIVALLYYLYRVSIKKMDEQQTFMDNNKMMTSIYVIDKKHDKISNINLPKAVQSQIPKYAKWLKMYFVKAKIGPQIVTLMCDKNVYNGIPLKKNVKAEIAGIYIVSFAGMKSAEEMKAIRKEKKKQEKEKAKKNK